MDNFTNQQIAFREYLSEAGTGKSVDLIYEFASFQNSSARLVKTLKHHIDKYGGMQYIPSPLLVRYKNAFSELFTQFSTLKDNLLHEMNENTKYLNDLKNIKKENSAIYEITLRRQVKLQWKIEFYENILILNTAINSVIL